MVAYGAHAPARPERREISSMPSNILGTMVFLHEYCISRQAEHTMMTEMVTLHQLFPLVSLYTIMTKSYGPAKSTFKNPFFYHHVEHGSRHRKDIQYDCSDNISHSTYYF